MSNRQESAFAALAFGVFCLGWCAGRADLLDHVETPPLSLGALFVILSFTLAFRGRA